MLPYNSGSWGVCFIFTLRGSVIQKACVWAVPSSLLSIAVSKVFRELGHKPEDEGIAQGVSAFTFVLGFLLVFRTQMAYGRYWDGAQLLRLIRGQWFNAASNLVSFCSTKHEKAAEVEAFQHQLIRLMSLLFCAAMQQVAVMEDEFFEIIDFAGMDPEGIAWVSTNEEKCEVIMQWIQRLIVDSMGTDVLPIAPPILSRVFQELSQGIVNVNQARAITDVPFPFPYAQIISVLLICYTLLTPVILAITITDWWWCGICTCFGTLVLWGINYIAMEIEMPFGEDPNDLTLKELQCEINKSLMNLIEPRTQKAPAFHFEDSHREIATRVWGGTVAEAGSLIAKQSHVKKYASKTPKRASARSSSSSMSEQDGSSSQAPVHRKSVQRLVRFSCETRGPGDSTGILAAKAADWCSSSATLIGNASSSSAPHQNGGAGVGYTSSMGSLRSIDSNVSSYPSAPRPHIPAPPVVQDGREKKLEKLDAAGLKLDALEAMLVDRFSGLDQRLARLNQYIDVIVPEDGNLQLSATGNGLIDGKQRPLPEVATCSYCSRGGASSGGPFQCGS